MFQQLIGRNVIMSGIQAEINRIDARFMSGEFVYGKKETDDVMPARAGVLQKKREFDRMLVVTAADHIKSAPEVPVFVVTVPAPGSIGVRIMARTVVMIGAARWILTRDLSFAIGVGVSCDSSTVSGEGMGAVSGDKPLIYRRKNSRKIKDILKDALGIVRKLLTGKDLIHHFPRGESCGFLFDQFPIRADVFFGFFGVAPGRKKGIAAIVDTGACPETVHEIVIGADGRKVIRGRTANKGGKDPVFGESVDPERKAELSGSLIKKQSKKDKRAQDLSLMQGGTSTRRIELRNVFANRVKIKRKEFSADNGIAVKKFHAQIGRKLGFGILKSGNILGMGLPGVRNKHKKNLLCRIE